jgi:hypothetical protein
MIDMVRNLTHNAIGNVRTKKINLVVATGETQFTPVVSLIAYTQLKS